jgi:hypothetical protein
MRIGREMSIIRGMHRRSRHVKKSKHAQLHAQSIPMRITALMIYLSEVFQPYRIKTLSPCHISFASTLIFSAPFCPMQASH